MYKNAIVRIRGEIRRDEIEKAAVIFMKKARSQRHKDAIKKKQVLDRQT